MRSCAILLALLGFSTASAVVNSGNPISRIVGLLNGLKDKLEEDLKGETELFETYECWYKTTVSTKTASNDAAATRIDSLKTYIADIEAGKIEFTTERQDLEKQIAGLNKDIEQAKTMRENEKKDFEAAKVEMEQGISALDKAIKTLDEGTKDSLMQKRSYVDMLSTKHSLQKSLIFARAFLDKADQRYLEQFLDEPKDWKKLNRKATFKNKYKASSGKIQETLKKLKKQFEDNLADAKKQEEEAVAQYEKLSKSKNGMLTKAEKALTDMAAEGGARGVSKTEAQNEVDALEDQVKADTKFITEAEEAFKTKQKEWDIRKEMRGKELLAMSQAIAVLASDDAKDQFTKSFSFIQESQSEPQRKCAARVISNIASKSSDAQLALLAVATGNEAIKKVIAKIDDIIGIKKKEEAEDLTKKEKCEADLSEAASSAKKASLDIDTASEDITRAKSQIEELIGQIKEQEEKKSGLNDQVKQLKRQREDENTAFKNDKLEDQKAIDLVKKALEYIKDWKNAKKAALITQKKEEGKVEPKVAAPTAPEGLLPPAKVTPVAQPPHRLAAAAIKVHTHTASGKQAPQFQAAAGEAPPPPPATWENPEYGGAEGEQKGVVGILELVMLDMEADIKSAEADEKQAVKDFEKEKEDLEGEIKACDTTIDAYTKDKADKEKIVADKGTERTTKKGELESQLKLYKSYKPGCDFLLVNFETRTKARQTEVDGLTKAKAILKGAKFGKSFLQEEC